MNAAHKRSHFFLFPQALLVFILFCSSALAAGQLDTTFNGTGKVQLAIGPFSTIIDLAVQPDGKIIAIGTALFPGTFGDYLIVRLNPDGTPDTTFGGGDGVVSTVLGDYTDLAQSVAVLPDGKILVAGYVETELTYLFGLVRYNTDGSIDTTFGDNGTVITPVNNEAYVWDMAVQYDGSIVVVGNTATNVPIIAVLRYTENGALDTTFDEDGIVTMSFQPGMDDRATSVAVQNDGKIVIGGFSAVYYPLHKYAAGGVDSSFAMARLTRDGKIDESFGNDGIVLTSLGGYDDKVFDIAIRENGKIIASGQSTGTVGGNCTACVGIAQYDQSGNLDPGFDTDGKVITNSARVARKMRLQPDGKPVMVSTGRSNDLAAVRTRPNGILDDLFGLSGLTTVDFGGADAGTAITLQTDGKVLIAGNLTFGTTSPFTHAVGIARLTGDSPIPSNAGINGRTTDAEGVAIGGSRVTLRNLQTGALQTVTANPLGYFGFTTLATDNFYEITAQKKGRRFPGKQTVRLLGNVNGLVVLGQ